MSIKDVKELGAKFANAGKGNVPLSVDGAAIRELAGLLRETGLTEIEIEQGGRRIRVARQNASEPVSTAVSVPVVSGPAGFSRQVVSDAPAPDHENSTTITSPMVGTVYVASEPGRPAFVKIGDSVREGATLLVVEAMKTMNPIVSPRAGVVREICVGDAQPVEYGQALIVLS
jgi:acetyl-CoA carboxylase biotin carboxyl carrier protein